MLISSSPRTQLPSDDKLPSLRVETVPLADTPRGVNSATFQVPTIFSAMPASVRAVWELFPWRQPASSKLSTESMEASFTRILCYAERSRSGRAGQARPARRRTATLPLPAPRLFGLFIAFTEPDANQCHQ